MLTNTAIIGALVFCLIKIPMLFVVMGPEEMRDLNGYLQVAEGLLPYRDFSWLYGPLPSLIYGNLLRIFPHTILTVRAIALFFWSIEVYFLIKILGFEIQNRKLQLFLGILVSLAIGYPGYAQNHVIAAAFLAATVFYLIQYERYRKTSSITKSFLCLLIVVFSRPLLMGYGVLSLWIIYFHYSTTIPNKMSLGFKLLGIGIGAFAIALFFWGSSLKMAFIPSFWYSQSWTGYPSVRYLIPNPSLLSDSSYVIKHLKGATDIVLFYGHYFIWPTFVTTSYFTQNRNGRNHLVMWLSLFSLVASSDVLFYGYQNPTSDAKMGHRAQYFIGIELVAWAVLTIGVLQKFRQQLMSYVLVGQLSALICIWSVLPYLNGLFQLKTFDTNPFGVSFQRGLVFHPRDRLTMEVIQFVNSICQPEESMILTSGYDPLLTGSLHCKSVSDRDWYLTLRLSKVVLGAFDSPYLPKGGLTSEELIERRLRESPPTIKIGGGDELSCPKEQWEYRDFSDGVSSRRVCWKKKNSNE